MSKITEQARVIVIENGEIRRGTVREIFKPLAIAIVNFDDETVEKVYLENLAIDPVAEPTENKNDQEPKEPVKKSEITITPDEFKKIAIDLVVELTKDKPRVGLALVAYASELSKVLFNNMVDND